MAAFWSTFKVILAPRMVASFQVRVGHHCPELI